MSEYYPMNGERLTREFNNYWNDKTFLCKKLLERFNLKFIPLNVVEKLVEKIDINKSSGILELNSRALKDVFEILIPELTHLFNESLKTGVFPNAWYLMLYNPYSKGGRSLRDR